MTEPREYEDGAFYWVTRKEISTVVRFDGEVGGFDCFGSFSDETLYPEQLRSDGYEIGPCIGKEPPPREVFIPCDALMASGIWPDHTLRDRDLREVISTVLEKAGDKLRSDDRARLERELARA